MEVLLLMKLPVILSIVAPAILPIAPPRDCEELATKSPLIEPIVPLLKIAAPLAVP